MDHALASQILDASTVPGDRAVSRYVNADEFCNLMVSHRRMVRLDPGKDRVRALRDLDTGEIFMIDERRLLAHRR